MREPRQIEWLGRFNAMSDNLRAALSEEAFTFAWAEGKAMSLEQAIAYALEDSSG
jgi:hypothetical protein